jgi:ATP-dependent RNA helicase DDX46/PRP5
MHDEWFLPPVACRVGRTGRAGNKGTAITFIGPDEDRYAPDLVKALKESTATVPQDLQV